MWTFSARCGGGKASREVMRKPRVALVTSLFPMPSQLWRGRPLYQTALALQQYCDVSCFCPVSVYPEVPGLRPSSFEAARPDFSYQPEGLPTYYFQYPTLPGIGRLTNGWLGGRRILPALRAFRPDVILSYWLYPDAYAALRAARSLGVPLVAGSRGSDLNRITRDAWTRRFVCTVLQESCLVLTVSKELCRKAVALGALPDRVRMITNGCDTATFRVTDKQEARSVLKVGSSSRLILYVGNLLATKGLLELLDAFVRLAANYPLVQLALIGQGPLEPKLRSLVSEAGLRDRVIMPGPAPNTEVARWMSACDIFCLPSYAEGCPNVVLEALACGRPVVGSAVGAIPDLLTPDCGLLIAPRDPDTLTSALREALDAEWDPAHIAGLHHRSWADVARETFQAIETCLKLKDSAAHPESLS